MSQILILNQNVDNVGVALKDIAVGDCITVPAQESGTDRTFEAVEPIPAGHKIALCTIEKGQAVMKYGYSIGNATETIRQGQYVHAHNVRSMRGKELLREGAQHD
ncbi:MAG: UxaA family hydrolase [Firmicutes bacterium]|nr:UxaA family hydrolase [Bacillota bacterium]